MSKLLLPAAFAALLAACTTQTPSPVTPNPEPPTRPTLVATGLTSPTGVRAMPDGGLLVVELGTGGDAELPMTPAEDDTPQVARMGDTARVLSVVPETGEKRELVKLPSIAAGPLTVGANRVMSHRGALYVSVGGWSGEFSADRPALSGSIARIDGNTATPLATTWDIEERENPDGGTLETNPFGLASAPDGSFWITDAAANALLRLEPESGEVSLVTTFPDLAPGVQAVPTGLAFGADGNALVTLYSGFPFPKGASKVVKVTPDGAVSDYVTGLSLVVDVRVSPDGGVYAVQLGEMGAEGPLPESGAILRLTEGRAEVVLDGLNGPSALSFSEAGDAYVTLLGDGPEAGSLVRYDGLSAPGSSAYRPAR